MRLTASPCGHRVYERRTEDVFAVQEELAQAITSTLGPQLVTGLAEVRPPRPTRSLEVYHLYLKGRHHWNSLAILLSCALDRGPTLTASRDATPCIQRGMARVPRFY